MRKILCPTDFSRTATKAVEYAAFIAQRAHAHLSLLHVVHLPIVDTSETALIAGELLGEQMRDAGEKLNALKRHMEEKYGANRNESFTCDYILKEALLTDIAEHLTTDEAYDLVVMGTTGGGNTLEELLIGSNAEAVIEHVKCPVLTIPSTANWPNIHKILFASDYTDNDLEALQQVAHLARIVGATVEVVHVTKEATIENTAKAEAYRLKLQQTFPEAGLQFQEVVNKHPDEGIKAYYDATGADMAAVLRKEKGFFRELFSTSLAEKMTYQASVPLLVLHARKQ
ncbi:universal stress protein [Botryobacter ruber]|uniref:universal stress protein n=1 Tax=Botryobacter ruber TaxID=2171629 RepID=UPI000E0C4E89|nr:universal stress protein [Botryobacter ruber]